MTSAEDTARRSATLKDVAERAGVHPGTASRALNPATEGLVNRDTVRRVRRAAKELAYQPNQLARGLRIARTMTVGVVVPDLTNPLFPPIVQGAEAALTAAGYRTLIANTDNVGQREREMVESFDARQADGLIVASAMLVDPALSAAAAEGRPIVLINRYVDGAALPLVTSDDTSGIGQALRHLADLGHERVGYLSGPMNISTGRGRTRAFRELRGELGLDDAPALVEESAEYSVEGGAEAARRLLAAARPTALLCGNDQIALGALDAIRELGLSCPDDISVIGYNDMPFIDKLAPPLTSVRVPHAQLGSVAAEMLVERLTHGRADVRTVVLPVELVVRRSTAPVRR